MTDPGEQLIAAQLQLVQHRLHEAQRANKGMNLHRKEVALVDAALRACLPVDLATILKQLTEQDDDR